MKTQRRRTSTVAAGGFAVAVIHHQKGDEPRVLVEMKDGCINLPHGQRRDQWGEVIPHRERDPLETEVAAAVRRVAHTDKTFDRQVWEDMKVIRARSGIARIWQLEADVVAVTTRTTLKIKREAIAEGAYYAWMPVRLIPEVSVPGGPLAWSQLRRLYSDCPEALSEHVYCTSQPDAETREQFWARQWENRPTTLKPTRPRHLYALSEPIMQWHDRVEELYHLEPEDRELQKLEESTPLGPLFFYDHKKRHGYLSQFFNCTEKAGRGRGGFYEHGQVYSSTEQYMMAKKAEVMDDIPSRDKILQCNATQAFKIKKLGREVGRLNGHFDPNKWDRVKEGIVRRGNFLKFSQCKQLRQLLLDTGDRILAEAAPYDAIWGIGVGVEKAQAGAVWRGTNLLGEALMAVRELLRDAEDESNPAEADPATRKAKFSESNPVYDLKVRADACELMVEKSMENLKLSSAEQIAMVDAKADDVQEDLHSNPKFDASYLVGLMDAAKNRARTRGSKMVTPRDVQEAAATIASEGRGTTPPIAPAAELPVHYDDMMRGLEALRTCASIKWGRSDTAWQPRVLIIGEKSGTIARMFLRAGCDVATCDLQPADGDQDGIPHFQGDCRMIQDLDWDLVIGHPPCQYLSNAGGMWLEREEGRKERVRDAAEIFASMASAKAQFVVIEQPKMHRFARTLLGNPQFQYLHPYEHGTGHTKPTGILVARGELPAIKPSQPVPGRKHAAALLSPSPYRSELRSQTYLGIAGAMAQQWVPTLWKSATTARQQDNTSAADRVSQAVQAHTTRQEPIATIAVEIKLDDSLAAKVELIMPQPEEEAVSVNAALSLPDGAALRQGISRDARTPRCYMQMSEEPPEPVNYMENRDLQDQGWMPDLKKTWLYTVPETPVASVMAQELLLRRVTSEGSVQPGVTPEVSVRLGGPGVYYVGERTEQEAVSHVLDLREPREEVSPYDPHCMRGISVREARTPATAAEENMIYRLEKTDDKGYNKICHLDFELSVRDGVLVEPHVEVADSVSLNLVGHAADQGISRVLPLPKGGPPRCASLPDFSIRRADPEENHALPRTILDPGAGMSVVSTLLLYTLPDDCSVELDLQPSRVSENLTGVAGRALEVKGIATITFNLGEGYGFRHEFVVIESDAPILLLGNDFWCRYSPQITYGPRMTGHVTFDHWPDGPTAKAVRTRGQARVSFTLPRDPAEQMSVNLVDQETIGSGNPSLPARASDPEGEGSDAGSPHPGAGELNRKSGFAPLDLGQEPRLTLVEEYLKVGPKSRDVLLFAREAINMDAYTSTIVWLDVPEELRQYTKPVMVERMPRRQGLAEQVGVACDLCYVDANGRVPVKLINLKPRSVSVAGYTPVARLIMDSELFILDNNDAPIPEEGAYAGLSEDVRKMVDQCVVDEDGSLNPQQKDEIRDLIAAYHTVFAPNPKAPRHTHVEVVKLPLKEGAKPHRHQPSRLGEVGREVVEKQVAELEAHGIIRKSNSAWASRIVLVGKKTGDNVVDSTRMCIDFRDLNSKLESLNSPLPRCDEAIDRLSAGAKGSFDSLFVTTMDLASGFHTLPIKEEDKKLTAFCTHRNQYEYNYLPFGVNSGPSYMVRLMDAALDGLAWDVCAPFLDDIAVFSHGKGATAEERHLDSFTEHKRRLRLVLERLTWAGLSAKASKCHFCNTSCDYLGHHVSRKGLEMEAAKVRSIEVMQPENLKTLEDVRSFVGLCSYYRKLIPQFAKLAAPLTDLTKTSEGIDVAAACATPEIQEAFSKLKQAMMNKPVLAMPDFSRQFIVKTDAAVKFGIGGVLSQKDDEGRERVVAYFSRKLSPAQRNYTVTEIELLAALESMKHWRTYLWGRPFRLIIDHQALKWLHSMQDQVGGGKSSRHMRWILSLYEYDFTVEHKPGVEHKDADGLSRLATLPPGDDDPRYEDGDPRVLAVTHAETAGATVSSDSSGGVPGNSSAAAQNWQWQPPPAPSKTHLKRVGKSNQWEFWTYDAIPGTNPWKYEWRKGPHPFGAVQRAASERRVTEADRQLRVILQVPDGSKLEDAANREGVKTFKLDPTQTEKRFIPRMKYPQGQPPQRKEQVRPRNPRDLLPVVGSNEPPADGYKRYRSWQSCSDHNTTQWVKGGSTLDPENNNDAESSAAAPSVTAAVLTAKSQHDQNRRERNADMSASKITDAFMGHHELGFLSLRESQAKDPECQALKRLTLGETDGTEHLQEAQTTDATTQRKQSWLQREAQHLYVHGGMLYRIDPVQEQKGAQTTTIPRAIPNNASEIAAEIEQGRPLWVPTPRPFLPEGDRQLYMEAYHDNLGHQGARRTYQLMRKVCYWPNMQKDISKHVAECHECTLSKRHRRENSAPRRSGIGRHPFDCCVVDVLSLAESANGYTKLLVFVDSLSRWVEAIPLKSDPTTEECIQHLLREVVCRHGVPRELRSDMGSNLVSKMAQHVAERTGYNLNSSAPEHHQTVGLAERLQQTLAEMIRTTDEGGEYWEEHLPFLLFAYRATPHRITDLSPAEILYGRSLTFPAQISHPTLEHGMSESQDRAPAHVKEYTRKLTQRLRAVWNAARSATRAEQEAYASREQDHGKQEVFEPEDWVVLKIHGLQNKLKYAWSMPKRIAMNLGDGNYLLWDMENKLVSQKQHVSNLRRYSAAIESIGTDEYMIEKLLDRRTVHGRKEYRVKWQGYNIKDYATWEPASSLAEHCQEMMNGYDQDYPDTASVDHPPRPVAPQVPARRLPTRIVEQAVESEQLGPETSVTPSARMELSSAPELAEGEEDEMPTQAKFERKHWHYARRKRTSRGLTLRWFVDTAHTEEQKESTHYQNLREKWLKQRPDVIAIVQWQEKDNAESLITGRSLAR